MHDSRKVRVIQVAPQPSGGGAEFLVREINRRLPDHGVESRAVYFTNPKGLALDKREDCLDLGSPRSPLAVKSMRAYLKGFQHMSSPVIVHAHLTWPLIYTPLAAHDLNVLLFYTEHSTYNKRRRIFFAKYAERALYRRYEHIVCISFGVRDALSYWLQDPVVSGRLEVLQNGARLLPLKEQLTSKSDQFRAVSVGSLNKHKGFEVAIHAIARARYLVTQYTIVGDGPERGRLGALIKKLQLEDTVRLVGWVDDIVPYLHEADVCIVPSMWEGFGLVAVEALSAGLPIIASDVAGLREVVEGCEAVWLVEPQNPIALVKALNGLRGELVVGKKFAEQARRRAESFDLDRMVGRYAESYLTAFA